MALNTKKYTRKNAKTGEVFRAVRVTATNFIDVANWAGAMAISKVSKDGDVSNQRVRVNKLVAQIGDLVVLKELPKVPYKRADYTSKDFFRVKDDTFEAEFKLKV